ERTLVDSVLDGRLLLGLACLAVWAALVVLAWRRGRRVEAFAVGWTAIALLPVANRVMRVGVVVAERALSLPPPGFVSARAAWSVSPQDSRLRIAAADAAFALRRPALADSLLRQAEQLCRELCVTSLRNQANAARARGDAAAADSLLARAVRLESP